MARPDPAIQELKQNALLLAGWIAAIRVAPYVIHSAQQAFKSK